MRALFAPANANTVLNVSYRITPKKKRITRHLNLAARNVPNLVLRCTYPIMGAGRRKDEEIHSFTGMLPRRLYDNSRGKIREGRIKGAVSTGCTGCKESPHHQGRAARRGATLTEGSGGMVQQLGIKGDWQLLTWTNGFQILVAASSNYTEGTPWYRIAVIKDGRIEYHDQIMVDPTAEDYEGVNNCDSFSPAIQALNGPVMAIGLECYNQGGDNNYATDHVLIFRVERPPTSMDDFTLLKRIKASPIVSGYYENSWTKTTLEVRGTEIWRTDVVTVGVSVEEEMQGIERESVVTTTSEQVLDY